MSTSLWQSSFIAQSTFIIDHPLQPATKQQINAIPKPREEEEDDFSDPLNAHNSLNSVELNVKPTNGVKSSNNIIDGPLHNTLLENSTLESTDYDSELLIGFKPWREFKSSIQENFHSKDLLSIETSFLKTSTTKHIVRKRLTDEPTSIGLLHDLTEEEYKRRFKELTRILHQLWNEERRLDCIKLCKEVAVMMFSSQSPRFYPQKFVLVTDLLETFGRLVYERLYKKANEERFENGLDPLSSHFTTIDILEKTRITARNWFGKLSEFKDIFQRIYIGTCLLPCLRFMDDSALKDNIMRLCTLACSIQPPITSSYARCYICRVSMRLIPSDRAPHWKCIHDWLQNYQQQPIIILYPALEFIIQCVAYEAVTFEDLSSLWAYCNVPDKRPFMLKAMFNALPPLYLAEHCMAACKLLVSSEHISSDEIYAFGESLLKTTVFEQDSRYILKTVWKQIKLLSNLKSFLVCCEVWVEFAARYFDIDNVHSMLSTIIDRASPDRKFEQYIDILISMTKRIVRSAKDTSAFVDSDIFTRFFQLFTHKESAREMSSIVLNVLIQKHGLGSLTDTSLAYQIIDLCKCVHDVITIHSSENAVTEAARLICRTLDRFDLKLVPEQSLSFFVAARATLLNLDECQKYLIVRILELGLFVVRSARFSTARSAFVQACVANAYITIPSLPDPATRIQIFIRSSEVALASMAFLQVESFVEACLKEFETFPKEKHSQFNKLLSEFLSFLLTMPVFEDKNNLSIYESLFECVKKFEWASSNEFGDALLAFVRFFYTLKNSSSTTNSQFMWSTNKSHASVDFDPLLANVFEQITSLIQNESDKQPLLSVLFLEHLAAFADGKIDVLARPTAKSAYKKCKGADESIVERMSAIKFT